MSITSGDFEDVKDSDIIIITAGIAGKPGQVEADFTEMNVNIIKDVVPKIMKNYNGGVLLVVSKPVDILTYVVQKLSGLPENKVIGTGTVLESSRLRYLLSEHCNMDVKNIHAYIIGEHGESQFPLWSATNIAGQKYDDFCALCTKKCGNAERVRIFNEVKNAGAKIIELKDATHYAIAMGIVRIVEAVLKNQNSILTVSSVIKDSYGINDVALSLPSVVNFNGIERMFNISLTHEEQDKLNVSAIKLKEILRKVM